MEEEKNKENRFPLGIAAIFVLAVLAGFAIANPGIFGQLAEAHSCGASAALQTPDSDSGIQVAQANQAAQTAAPGDSGGFQEVKMAVDRYGYEPNQLVLKKGVPVKWIIDVRELTGCNKVIVARDYGINVQLKTGQNIVEFTPEREGAFRFTCGMGMIQGTFVVVNDTSNQTAVDNALSSAPAPAKSGGCGCGMH